MWRVSIVLFCLFSSTAVAAPDTPEASPFSIETLLDGVWLFRVPADSAEYTNSLVVERDAGLLVVDVAGYESQLGVLRARCEMFPSKPNVSLADVDDRVTDALHPFQERTRTDFPRGCGVI